MNNTRKDLETKIDANYQRYLVLRDKLSKELPSNSTLLFELSDIYHNNGSLRYSSGIEMVSEVYELNK